MIIAKRGDIMELKDKILNLRKTHGMSQQGLADQLGVSRQSVSKWELGESYPDINNVIVLSEVFHVTTDYLLKEDISEQKTENDISQKMMIISLLIVLFGCICGYMLFNNYQDSISLLIGIFIQMIGIEIFEYFAISKHNIQIQKTFWSFSIWVIPLLPIRYFVSYTLTYQIVYMKFQSLLGGGISGQLLMYFPLFISLGLSAILFALIRKLF